MERCSVLVEDGKGFRSRALSGKVVARRHREMREGVWASPPGKVLARVCGNCRQQAKAAAHVFCVLQNPFSSFWHFSIL